MDPLFGIATNLATDMLKAIYRRSHDSGLGNAETQALRRAFAQAFSVLKNDVVQARHDKLTPELAALVEEQLRRLVTDAAMADMLFAAALEERGPDLDRLRERFEELGFDPQTFLTDFDTAMSRFRYALTNALQQEAGVAGSPLFNKVVLAQLADTQVELAHLAGRLGADEHGTPAGPYSVIKPTDGKADWRTLLDGSALPAVFGIAGILERTLVIEDVPYDTTAVLAWLAGHSGRTVFLGGSRGDGKTSYLNALAARSVDSHCFLRWGRNAPFSIQVAEDIAAKVRRADPDRPTTIVIVYPVDASHRSEELDQLCYELARGVGEGDRRAVVIVEGDDGTFERLPFYAAHWAKLLPPGPESVQPWVSLLRRAHDEVRHEGEDERHISARYPNLAQFLDSSPEQQAEVLADPQSPMIVRLLRAVYGADMWGKLYDELVQLEPPSPDAMCYIEICLATVASRGIPTAVLERLQPDAQWELRSQRNPWVLDEEDQHVARHRTIAQVVLEKAAKRSNGRFIRDCMSELAAHLRTPDCGVLVPQIVMTVTHLSPVASEDETDKLRKAVFYGARRGLHAVDDVASAIEGQCGRDYRNLSTWMEMVRLLIPRQSRDSSHLWLVDLYEDLLEAADRTRNPPEPERLEYYRWKTGRLRAWLLNEDDYEYLIHAVRQVVPFVGAPWCRADFYTDLFRWCFQATRSHWTKHMTGQNAIDGRFLYSTLFTAYERLRSCTTDDRITDIRIDFNTKILPYVHWTLPDDAASLLEDAWKTSVELGCPDAQVGTLLAELLLTGDDSPPFDQAAATSACRTLDTVLEAFPDHGEALFLLALAQSRLQDLDDASVDSLPGRIAAARKTGDSALNQAFIMHAAALVEPDASCRRQLLLNAATGYMDYVEDRRANNLDSGHYAQDRLRFVCSIAFRALARFGGSDVEQARQRYRRIASE